MMPMDNNSIQNGFRIYANWCRNMDPSTFTFIVRCNWLVAFPCILGYAVLCQQKSTAATSDGVTTQRVSVFAQGTSVLVGTLLALSVRIPEISNPTVRTWTVTFALVLILCMPAILPRYLVPAFHIQQRVIWVIYTFILFLILLQVTGSY